MPPVSIPFRRRLRFRVEVALFSFALTIIPSLSRGMVVRLARVAGCVAWALANANRRIAMANLDLAYGPSLSRREKRILARRVFITFAQTGLDYFWFSRDRQKRMDKWVVMEESMKAWMRKGAFIAVTAHFGNWEILGWMTASMGCRIASVAKPVKNPAIDAEINRLRTLSGQIIVPREGAIRSLMRVLKEEGMVALLLDQDTLPSDGGVFVPFFGMPVPIASAAAGLALRLRAPIFMAFCTCDDRGVYRCYSPMAFAAEEITGMSAEDVTIRITGALEQEIRKSPGYWLWTYKRWKRRVPGVDPSRYPFYADC